MDFNERAAIRIYIGQLGVFSRKAPLYLCRVVEQYMDCGCKPEYEAFLSEIAHNGNVRAGSVRQTIRHFLQKSWDAGFGWAWKQHLGWDGEQPPQTMEAVRLICENYPVFVKRYAQKRRGQIVAIDIDRLERERIDRRAR